MANFVVEDLKSAFKKGGNGLIQIILINVVVFFAVNIPDVILQGAGSSFSIGHYLALPADLVTSLFRFWTYVTYMFLHGGVMHILFNMLWLYILGKVLQQYIGSRKLIAVFFFGGLAGGIAYVIAVGLMDILAPDNPLLMLDGNLRGASAGVQAVILAAATIAPNHSINLMFIGPVRIKYIALFGILMTLLNDYLPNTGGMIAHLGGAAMGYYFIKAEQSGKDLSSGFWKLMDRIRGISTGKKQPKMKATRGGKPPRDDHDYNKRKKGEQQRVDEILDKISKSGYDSLSKTEKEFLFNVSQKNK